MFSRIGRQIVIITMTSYRVVMYETGVNAVRCNKKHTPSRVPISAAHCTEYRNSSQKTNKPSGIFEYFQTLNNLTLAPLNPDEKIKTETGKPMKRIMLFLLTNIAIMVVLSITLRLLGVDSILAENGSDLNIQALVILSGVIGFGGSFISLLISKWMAKRMTGAVVITNPVSNVEKWLISTVEKQAKIVGIKMPEVAIFPSSAMNAFATGASKNKALMAVSQGLLDSMSQGEIEAVVGHEMSHIANGDMVTLALIQGVVNTFVVFLSRVIGHVVDRVILKNNQGHGIGYFVSVIVAQIVLSILASTIVMYFSRKREFIADTGGADLAGHQNMINALKRLGQVEPEALPEQMAAFGINDKGGVMALFSSHPPIEDRIVALEQRALRG